MNGNNTKNPKSAATAGVLALVLGIFGAHNWYLNDRRKAKTHVGLAIVAAGAFLLSTIFRLLISSVSNIGVAQFLSSMTTIARLVGWFVLLIDVIWAVIEGILLFLQGDEGLAERGYNVAKPEAPSDSNATPASTPASTPPANAAPASQPSPLGPPPVNAAAATQPDGQPILYSSSDIQQPSQPQMLGQAVSTQDVETPALTVQDAAGKTTVNPVILRRVIIAALVIIGGTAGVFLVKASIDSAFAVSYGDAYRVVREIAPNLTAAAKSSSCQYTVDYVRAPYVDKSTYSGYIDVCRGLATSDSELVTKLGQTGAMKWDSGIATQYKEFQELYEAAFANADKAERLVQAMDLYQSWHNYILAADLLTVNSPAEEFQKAADILRQSGNEVLAKYGDEWYYRELDYLTAYQTYWELSYTSPEKEPARLEAETKRDELKAWVEDHRPDVLTLAPFEVPNLTPVYDSFTKLYGLIRTGYEQHYDYKSGDCQTAGKQVYCS